MLVPTPAFDLLGLFKSVCSDHEDPLYNSVSPVPGVLPGVIPPNTTPAVADSIAPERYLLASFQVRIFDQDVPFQDSDAVD